MLKSCKYCGRIHDSKTICEQKRAVLVARSHYNSDPKINDYRQSDEWRRARVRALERDKGCCVVCMQDKIYNSHKVSVHHIVALAEDYNKRNDTDNLITLCQYHHEQAEGNKITKRKLFDLIRPPANLL